MITIEIRGEKEVIDGLRKFKSDTDKGLRKALAKTGLKIQSAAKLRLKQMRHYITGRLASSIHSEVKEGYLTDAGQIGGTVYDYEAEVTKESFDGTLGERAEDFEVLVGTNVEYATKIEMQYDSYLRFAAEQGDKELTNYIKEQIDENVKEANGRG
jgi:phage gpG-like protein